MLGKLKQQGQAQGSVGIVRVPQSLQQTCPLLLRYCYGEEEHRRDAVSARCPTAGGMVKGGSEAGGCELQDGEREVSSLEGGGGVKNAKLLIQQVLKEFLPTLKCVPYFLEPIQLLTL